MVNQEWILKVIKEKQDNKLNEAWIKNAIKTIKNK